jgi:hypothetical protein
MDSTARRASIWAEARKSVLCSQPENCPLHRAVSHVFQCLAPNIELETELSLPVLCSEAHLRRDSGAAVALTSPKTPILQPIKRWARAALSNAPSPRPEAPTRPFTPFCVTHRPACRAPHVAPQTPVFIGAVRPLPPSPVVFRDWQVSVSTYIHVA